MRSWDLPTTRLHSKRLQIMQLPYKSCVLPVLPNWPGSISLNVPRSEEMVPRYEAVVVGAPLFAIGILVLVGNVVIEHGHVFLTHYLCGL